MKKQHTPRKDDTPPAGMETESKTETVDQARGDLKTASSVTKPQQQQKQTEVRAKTSKSDSNVSPSKQTGRSGGGKKEAKKTPNKDTDKTSAGAKGKPAPRPPKSRIAANFSGLS